MGNRERAINPYNVYFKDKYASVKTQQTTMDYALSALGGSWRNASKTKKKPYVRLAKAFNEDATNENIKSKSSDTNESVDIETPPIKKKLFGVCFFFTNRYMENFNGNVHCRW